MRVKGEEEWNIGGSYALKRANITINGAKGT
jgi:hypothetical protein